MKSFVRRGGSPPSALLTVGLSGDHEDVVGGALRKIFFRLALLALVCASLLTLAEPGWAQSGAAPPNDDFADAEEVSGVSVEGTTDNATRETGEPDHYTSNPADASSWEGDHSVWYSWTAPDSGPKTIDTCDTNIDSILAVYTGDSLSDLDRVADNNNDYCGGGWGSKVTFEATAGTTYRIAVSDAGGLRENTFTLAIGDPEADLSVEKYAPDQVVHEESFYYEIYVSNNGPATATNVVLEDTLPEGLDFAGFPSDDQCSYDEAERKISCDFGDLANYYEGYDYAYVSFEVTPTEEGTLENTATATSDTTDSEVSNDQSTVTTEVVAPSADLSVDKSAPGSVLVDELFTYEISVSNNGPTTATDVVLEDTLPNGLDFAGFPSGDRCSYEDDTREISCDLDDVGRDNSHYVSFEVTATDEGTLENTASVSSGASDPESSNNQDTAATEVVLVPTPPEPIFNDPGCRRNVLARNDDGSTGAVALPFTPNFFGQTYSQTYVNNNGNVTFDGPLSTFTPFDLSSTNHAIIAPFFADVDTRNSASDRVTYGNASFGDREAFCVNWTGVAGGVGYYPSQANKLNSFQLLLVDRSDTGEGNFDIIMNYNKVLWETGGASGGVDGLGGSSARVGYSNGQPVNSFELPGSAVNGAFLDSNLDTGLIHGSRGSLQDGRYVFEVRNGDAPVGGTISGGVFENSVNSDNALSGSLVQVCDSDNSCLTSSTNSAGEYSVSGLFDGEYEVRAFPPGGSSLQQNEIGPVTLSDGETLVDQNVVLTGPTPPPDDTSLDGGIGETGGGIPIVVVGQPLQLETTGCEGGTATYEVTGVYGGSISGSMAEGPPGTYTANFSLPFTGPAEISITIDCSGPDDETVEFDIYIDPSGNVYDTNGDPIEGATATLFRSDSSAGPFTQVPDGSAIMSDSNRDNPDETNADGHFGWLTIAGYYIVRAEMEDCVSPDDPNQTFVETDVLPVPPEQVGLELILDCPSSDDTPPVLDLPDDMTVEAEDSNGAEVTFTATAEDDVDGDVPVTCDPASGSTFPIGPTTVECSATDAANNTVEGSFQVIVVDTTKPSLTLPSDISKEAERGGVRVDFADEVSASDIVDGSVSVTCDPASDSTFNAGTTPVSCTATDSHDNTATGTFSVIVADTTDPVLTLSVDKTVEATGRNGASVDYEVSATDTVDDDVEVSCDPASGSTFPLGATTVECTASDEDGNTDTGDFKVTVVDTTKPVLTLPADITKETTTNNGATVGFANQVSATDTVDGSITPTCTPASGSTFPIGTTTVTCKASDSRNNQATGSFKITVKLANNCTKTGTEGRDLLVGTSGNDVICGLGGDDVIMGLDGNDTIIGGSGKDILVGLRGNDTLKGGDDDDLLIGTDGVKKNDILDGEGGNNFCQADKDDSVKNCQRANLSSLSQNEREKLDTAKQRAKSLEDD